MESSTGAWEYGLNMLAQGDVESALAVLQSVVARTPNDVAQRRELREIERQIRARQPLPPDAASTVMTEVWFAIHRAKHKQASQFVDWDVVDRAAEQGLAVNPLDADLHLELGQASEARGYRQVAEFAYRCAVEAAPERADARQRLAELTGIGERKPQRGRWIDPLRSRKRPS